MVARKYALLGIALVLVLSIVGCGGDSSDDEDVQVETIVQTPKGETSTAQATGVEHKVDFSSTWFSPPMVTIRAGDSVVFTNVDTESHPLINEELGIDVGPFDGEHTLTFYTAGLYLVRNELDQAFLTVDVQAQDE